MNVPTLRGRWRPRLILATAATPLLVAGLVAPAAWAGEPPEPDAPVVPVETLTESVETVESSEAVEAIEAVETVEAPEIPESTEAVEDAAPAPAEEAPADPAPEALVAGRQAEEREGLVKAVSPVLQPGQSIIVNHEIVGAWVISVAIAGPAGEKRIEVASPSGGIASSTGTTPVMGYRHETGSALADGTYRFIFTNRSEIPMQFSYEIAWHSAVPSFVPIQPRPNSGLLVATEARLAGEPMPAGTTATVRVVSADGAVRPGSLTQNATDPELWQGYFGNESGTFIVHAEFDTGDAVYSRVWTTFVDGTDEVPPVLAYQTVPAASNSRGWFARDVVATLIGTDSGSGVAAIEWRINGGAVQSLPTASVDVGIPHGSYEIEYRAIDRAGNASDWRPRTVRVDTVAPSVDAIVPAPGAEYRLGEDLTVGFGCSDAFSGIFECRGDLANGEALPTDVPGDHTFDIVATDNAGGITRTTVEYRVVEPTPPGVDLEMPDPDGANGWFVTPPSLRLTGSAGVVELRWRDVVDGVTETGRADGATATVTPGRDGMHQFSYWALDDLGMVGEPTLVEYHVDAGDPVIEIRTPVAARPASRALAPGEVVQGSALVADFECSDAVSGLDACEGTVEDGERLPTDTLGWHEFEVTATDLAGNTSSELVRYRVVAAPAPGTAGTPGLAATGLEIATWIVPLGLVLLAGGVAVLVAARVRTARR